MSNATSNALQEDLTLLVPPSETQRDGSLSAHGQIVVLAVAGLIAATIVWKKFRQKSSSAKPGEAPGRIALRELSQWENLEDVARYRAAVFEVSGTLRQYVEARFGLTAPNLTTEQFWEELRTSRSIPETFDPFWMDFTAESDRIKYAGATPDRAQFSRMIEAACGFVRETRTDA
jgi:hypothetical protein